MNLAKIFLLTWCFFQSSMMAMEVFVVGFSTDPLLIDAMAANAPKNPIQILNNAIDSLNVSKVTSALAAFNGQQGSFKSPTPLAHAINLANTNVHRDEKKAQALRDVIDLLLNSGLFAVNAKEPYQLGVTKTTCTPLIAAAAAGNVPLAKHLIETQGATVNLVDDSGQTALHWAAHIGSTEMVTLLLKHNANVHAKTKYGHDTPLHYSAHKNHVAVNELLIAAKASLDARNARQKTPQYYIDHHKKIEGACGWGYLCWGCLEAPH